MLNWFRTTLDVNRGRNAAVATIRPLVDGSRRRLGGISDSVWLDPYMLGFLTMLITITAKYRIRSLDGQAMSNVQAAAWQAITGLDYEVGEDIILLSEARDQKFMAGCSDAMMIASDFHSSGVLGAPVDDGYLPRDDLAANGAVSAQAIRSARWRQVFDAFVSER